MKKRVLSLSVILFSILSPLKAQETTPQIDAFLQKIEGASLEELEKELDEGIDGLKAFMGFFTSPEEDIKTFTTEEERFSEPFNIDTSMVHIATNQYDHIGFVQTFKEQKSHLKFQNIVDDYWSSLSLPEGMEEWFTPKKIYFKDGTSSTEGISDNKISFFWEEEWLEELKVIDSIEIDYHINYTTAYDSLDLHKKTKKLHYKTGEVKVKKLEKNHLYITISDDYANGFYLRALNREGKPLSESSSSFSPTSDKASSDVMTEMISLLEDILGKLKKGKFKDTEAVKKYLVKKFSKIEEKKDTDGVRHLKFYFNGNIDSLMLYFETEESSQTVPFIAVNDDDFRKILLGRTKEHLIFMDELANELFRIDERPLERIGDRFFFENDTYFYLNTVTKSLDSMQAVQLFEATNGLVFIQKKEENGFMVHDAHLKQFSTIEFSNVRSIDEQYAHALDFKKEHYAVDAQGKIKKIEGVTEIGNLSEGLLIAKSNEQYGFINAAGEIAIPFAYREVELFKEGLALVANEEGRYGFIDKKGKIVLPMVYERAYSFENGIALVSAENGYQLINPSGTVVVNSEYKYGYAINGRGIQKTYQFGDKTYDAFGNFIPKEKTEN